jgi:hypothetical protein
LASLFNTTDALNVSWCVVDEEGGPQKIAVTPEPATLSLLVLGGLALLRRRRVA